MCLLAFAFLHSVDSVSENVKISVQKINRNVAGEAQLIRSTNGKLGTVVHACLLST